MRIKVLEETGIRHGSLVLSHDDQVTVPDEVGRTFCELGWAEDLSGEVPTGERDTRPRTVDPKTVTTTVTGG